MCTDIWSEEKLWIQKKNYPPADGIISGWFKEFDWLFEIAPIGKIYDEIKGVIVYFNTM